MVIKSKINGKRFVWTKIPRTGTVSYAKLFNVSSDIQFHIRYINEVARLKEPISGVSVVRHPLDRFVSSLKFMIEAQQSCRDYKCRYTPNDDACNAHNYKFPTNTIADLCHFLSNNFDTNCIYKYPLETIFGVENSIIVTALFTTQLEWAYHPKVKIFKYERLNEFNNWIETELGYDTNQLSMDNTTKRDTLSHLDFTDPLFVKTVEKLFHCDYIVFDYPFSGL